MTKSTTAMQKAPDPAKSTAATQKAPDPAEHALSPFRARRRCPCAPSHDSTTIQVQVFFWEACGAVSGEFEKKKKLGLCNAQRFVSVPLAQPAALRVCRPPNVPPVVYLRLCRTTINRKRWIFRRAMRKKKVFQKPSTRSHRIPPQKRLLVQSFFESWEGRKHNTSLRGIHTPCSSESQAWALRS